MTTVVKARPDLDAHSFSVRADFPELVDALRDLLGPQLVAYIGGVGETRAVHEWARGDRKPSAETQQRLRLAYQVAAMLCNVDGKEITQAWFQGLNPQLDDRSPARTIREGKADEVGSTVVGAARSFLAE